MGEALKKTRWQTCNVLHVGVDARDLWAFSAGKQGFNLTKEELVPPEKPLPPDVVTKDWKALLQPQLNVAWLPVEKVFLRVIQLPVSSFDELLSMAELQLEKLSPLPVTHICWSIHLLGEPVDNLQTIIVVIVAREVVEKFLGELEGQGYLADRLEVPFIDQLESTKINEDGAWIYPGKATGQFVALVAWWQAGLLKNLSLLHIPAVADRSAVLQEQLRQLTWAGELEGWMSGNPKWHLVADESTAVVWQPMFKAWLGEWIATVPPVTTAELAALSANRAARASQKGAILPVEYYTRYRQEFVDKLWIRGLLALFGTYAIGVAIFFLVVGYKNWRVSGVEADVRKYSLSYTNTLQLKSKMQVLKDRDDLKYASLDCWKAVAELLPESLTLQTMEFKSGRSLRLNGIAPADQSKLVTDFNDAFRKYKQGDQMLFDKVELPVMGLTPDRANLSWSFNAELVRGEELP